MAKPLPRIAAIFILMGMLTGCSDFMNGRPFGMPPGPVWNGVDLDCADVGHPVWVKGNDPHGLDGDNDGIGCE
jgi:hypothetical protein